MTPRLSLSLALAVAVLAAGCSKYRKVEKEQAARPPVTFPHATHAEQGLECGDCHAKMDEASSLAKRHLPPTDKCKECHDDKVAPAPPKDEPRLTFAHEIHVPQVEKCTHCHKKLPEPGEPRVAPPMAVCTSCHNHQQDFAEARCSPCHVDLKSYPLLPQTAFRHEGDWLRVHGPLAKPTAQSCAACHDQTYCAECHASQTAPTRLSIRFPERVDRAFIHRGDYVSRHMADVAADPASCQRCHGTPFCASCHELRGVRDLPGIAAIGENSPHPDGWSIGAAHGRAAQRNILACAGCHDNGADAVCVACHRTVNPHPSGFVSKHRGDDRSDRPCSACHVN